MLLRDEFGLLEYVNADTIAHGLSAFQPEKAAFEAGRIMLRRLQKLSMQRADFAFESTFSGRSHAPWLSRLRRGGYNFHLLFLWLRTPELAVQRVKERVSKGGHDVPEAIIRRRYQKGLQNFFKVYRPLADTWGLYDNSRPYEPLFIATGEGNDPPVVHQQDLWSTLCEKMP